MSNKYEIKLGVQLDTSDIQDQIRDAGKSIKPIEIKIDAETKELTQTIKDALKDLSKGTKNALTLDTTKIEASFREVRDVIADIRTSLGTLDNKSGMKSLVSTIGQISKTLDTASSKIENLSKELSALSKKDFSINLGINTASNPIARNTAYGNKVRNETLPQLRQQAEALESYLKQYYKVADGFNAAQKLIQGSGAGAGKANLFDLLPKMLDNTGSLSSQMTAYKEYIALIKEAAGLKNVDISGVLAQFSKQSDELVKDAQDIQTGAKETENALKSLFGSSIDADGLNRQLDSIVSDLGEIRTSIQSLSSGNSIDGLTQSFNRLSETLERLTSNLTLAKNSLDTGFSNSNAVKSAEQLGRKIGDAVEKSVEQSINIDDVIDKQVLKLMNEYAISGEKGSNAFNEIRQSLVDFRNGSADINKVTSAISNNMKVVNEAKNDYKDLAEYIKMFNASGAKVHIQDSIRQEYGDDYKSMRSQLGKGFTSGQGMDFETFIVETNEILGQTIDLSHGAEAAFGDLVNKVNSTKGSKFLTGDDLFRSGILDMGDVVANVSTSLEEIENAEEKIAQASVTSANTVVQNEERKQQAIKQTDDAIDRLSNKKTANIGLENVESDLKEITVVADNAEDVIEAMDNALNHLGVGSTSADAITRDIQEIGIEVSKVTTKINGSNLEMSITGIQKTADGLERVVTETKRYKDAVSNVENINKTFSQSFETSADAAKKLEKETTAAFKKLKYLAQDMGKIDIEISGFEANGEIDKANSLKRVLNDLESEFKDLYAVTEKNLSLDQIKDLDKIFANTTGEVREFKNELAKSAETKELTSGLERLKSITREISGLKIDIFKFDDADNIERATNQLNKLENEAAELRVELQKKFPTASFDEIDDIAKKGEKALSDLINKATEAKAKLAESIKLDIEVGKFDDGISKMKNNFNSLSGASKELYESVERVERAYLEMEKAAGFNDDEVVDTERLIKAQKEYADALEKTNNLIRIQAREEKAKNDADKLTDDIGVFQQKIDTWLTKNSAATRQFGNSILNLRAQAEGCDRVTLNHLEKEFKKIDSVADKAGLKVENFTDRLKNKFKEYAAYLSAAEIFMYVEQALQDMFEQVVAIDTAMTELKKVTDETDASYNRFLSNAASRAKEIGTTMDGLISSTADFARLGYGFKDAQGLAEVANIYAVVGDEINGVEGATESLVSTLAAFKSEMNGMSDTDFALSIVDKMNEVANNYAISSGGIGEALKRSASSMSAANNSLDETIALITAANTVVQDPDTIGTAFKTISMRIRGAETELAEAGLETEGMVESTAKLREEIMALSGVDIMLNKDTFKSTYQILDELSQRWQNLTDIQQASVTELIAGKRQGNIISSLMSNFDVARNALNTSLNSSGSAMKEHEKWSQSLEARLLKLKAAWQSFAQTFMDSKLLKGGIDVLIKFVDILDKLIDKFGLLGTVGLGTAGYGLFKFIKGDAADAVKAVTDVIDAVGDVTKTISNAAKSASGAGKTLGGTAKVVSEVADTMGDMAEAGSNIIKSTDGVSGAVKNTTKAIGNVAEVALDGADAMSDLGDVVKKTNGGFKAFMKTPLGVASAIGVLIAAITLAYNAYKKAKEAASEARHETIKASSEFLDSATSFEQAYIKYSGKTNLTAQEESELETAINGTVDALGDKSSALKDVVNSSNDYVTSLEAIKNAELEAAKKAAEDKKRNAELELEEAAMGWERWDGSEVNFEIDPDGKAYDIAKKLNSEYLNTGKRVINDFGSAAEFAKFELSKDATTKDIIGYYNTLVDYRNKLKEELSEEELMDSSEYDEVNAAIEKMSESINTYIEGVYEAAKAQYQLANGIPKTTEEYIKMREAILNNEDLDGVSVEALKGIANDLDADYGQVFDLSSVEFQARKLVGILDEYGDSEVGTMEAFLNMRTAVNNNECTVGEYMSQFDEINKMTEDWSDEAKKELNASFGLDADSIKHQYEEMEKYLLRLVDIEPQKSPNGYLSLSYLDTYDKAKKDIQEFLNSLTSEELSAFVSIKTDIDWQNTSKKDILKQIQKEAEFLEAMNYTIAIDVETGSIDALNSALAESASATGLSSESLAALKDRYSELASHGYDLSSMFEETSNGIHLNKRAVSELEQAYASSKLTETDGQLEVLKRRYNELTNEIKNCSDAGKRAELYSDQQEVVQKINDLATLAAQYEGLASAYSAWQNMESSGSERDMYESIIEGFETVGDEIKRGWYDDGTIKFLELITGQTDLAGKSASELKEIWNSLDDTIKGTSYSVRDFFTTDEDGNSTSTGAYNFLRAVEELGKNGGLKALKDKNIGNLVERNSEGKIVSFDFDVVGGDEAIAKALGVSEEMVQIIQRTLDDAGFVVTLNGKYTLLADLQTSAEEANNTLKKLQSEGLEALKDVDLEFNFDVNTVEGYQEQLEKAMTVLDKFRDKNGKLKTDANGNLVEGAQKALDIAEYYTAAMDKLTEPKFMQIDTSTVDKELQEPIGKLQEIGDLCKEKHLVALTGDTEDLKEVQGEIDKVAKEIEELDPEIKAQIGIDENWDSKTIADKIEKGEIEIPAELELDVQMSDDLKDMRLMMMNQLGLVSDEEVKLKVGFDIDDSIIDGLTDKQQKIVIEYIVENEKEFEKYTEVEKEAVVKLVANGVEIDKYKAKDKEAVVNYIANGKEVDGWTPEAKDAFVKYLADGGEIDKFDPKNKESWVIYNTDTTKPDSYNADKNGTVTYNTDTTDPDNYDPDKDGTVTYGKDSRIPDKYNPDKNGVVTFKKDSSAIDKWKPVVSGIAKFTLSMIIPQSIRTALSKIGISIANGTANVDGTANGSAFSDGTATKLKLAGKSGKALKQGDWGVKKTETALTGELGPELVVYGNRYWTVGDSGAEFSHIPKGAIVFNHRQTEEIFKYGKVTSGGGRGKIYANGTAFAQGTAYGSGSGGGEEPEVTSVVVGTNPVTGEKYTKDTDDAKDEFEETIDWIETAIDRVERAINQLDTKAGSVYRSWSERNRSLINEISEVGNEIALQEQAYEKYLAAANAVGLSSSYVDKVKNGTIDIETITDEVLKEKIDDFKNYYEAALDCQDAIVELQEKEKELYQQRFDNDVAQFENMLSVTEHQKNMLDEYIAQSEAQAHLISENYYKALISTEKEMISTLQAERDALLYELSTQERGTEQW